mgnify:CR=1 FL=1
MNNRAVGIKRRGRARGNSHLSSGAEGAKGEGRRQSRGKHDQINVARKKDGDGQTDGNADVCTRTVGREKTAAEPTGRPNTAPGNVMRAGRLKLSRGAPYFLKNSALVAGFFTAPILAKKFRF